MSAQRRKPAEQPDRHEPRGWVAHDEDETVSAARETSEEGGLKTFLRRLGMLNWLSPKPPGVR